MKKANKLICNSCNTNEAIGVYCVPACPVSMAYCQDCLDNDSHNLDILAANVACCGGLESCAEWWKELIQHSLDYQHKTIEWFNEEVNKCIKRLDEYCEEHDRLLDLEAL
jgi:hypothetical protein